MLNRLSYLSIFFLCLYTPSVCLNLNRPQFSRLQKAADVSLLSETARDLEISPPWNAPSWLWAWAWKIHAAVLPLLHAFDRCNAKDSFVNLYVLWWKAIAGNRVGSRTYDGGFAHDLLPSLTRAIVAFPLCYLYPDLHHQNVAMRTLYLDQALRKSIESTDLSPPNSTCVVILGGGFDARSLRFAQNPKYKNVRFFEFDLPQVIEQKRKMLSRFIRRRPKVNLSSLPTLVPVDLNNINNLRSELERLCISSESLGSHIIFVSEAVLLYLEQENLPKVLSTSVQTTKKHFSRISFCFADRLINRSKIEVEDEERQVSQFLKETALLNLNEFRSKPGKARHLGIATYGT